MPGSIAIVGGGVSGLAAALDLAQTHKVIVLEAGQRLGGRILSVRGPRGIPYELGAEFVHGNPPELWNLIHSASLRTHSVPDRHWAAQSGTLRELPDFWEKISSVTKEIATTERDTSFREFLATLRKPREYIQLARGFVEGFHGAPLSEASARSTRLSEETSEKMDGQRLARITGGFDHVPRYLEQECRNAGVELRLLSEVVSVDYRQRPALIHVKGAANEQISLDRILIALPIGVLRSGAITFSPTPASKLDAIHALGVAMIAKIILHFREPFWPEPNFGFIHAHDESLPTWWADEGGPILTGWAGGKQGADLLSHDAAFVLDRALESLSRIFGESPARIRGLLLSHNMHNWRNDPFASGAYSFITPGAADAPEELARPEQELLFFAGEATDLDFQFGTVHGAIASGRRAARQIMQC